MRRSVRLAMWPILVCSLVACSVKEDKFVSKLTTADCAYALSCWDDDVLTQYGFTDQESCEAEQGPIVAQLEVDCAVYDPRAARECIKAVKDRTCQDSTNRADLGRPEVCDTVFTSCEGDDTAE